MRGCVCARVCLVATEGEFEFVRDGEGNRGSRCLGGCPLPQGKNVHVFPMPRGRITAQCLVFRFVFFAGNSHARTRAHLRRMRTRVSGEEQTHLPRAEHVRLAAGEISRHLAWVPEIKLRAAASDDGFHAREGALCAKVFCTREGVSHARRRLRARRRFAMKSTISWTHTRCLRHQPVFQTKRAFCTRHDATIDADASCV